MPLRDVALGNLIDIAAIGGILMLTLARLRRTASWPAYTLTLAALLPALLFYRNAALIPWPPRPRSFFLLLWPGLATWRWPPTPGTLALLALAWVILLFILYLRAARAYRLMLRFGGIVLTGFGVFGAMVCLQLARVAVWQPGLQEIRSVSPPTATAAGHPVIVWMVFDELSYDQTFEHRAADLALPNFDHLRAESTLYARVQPAGFATATVLPSLFLGKTVTKAQYTSANEFKIHTLDGPEWKTFDPERTIFAEGKAHGWKSAITGWWNPYCPVLQSVLESCYWSNWDAFDVPMSPRGGLWRNSIAPLDYLARDLLHPGGADDRAAAFSATQHRLSYDDLYTRAAAMLQNADADFLFLHLPVPHPPSVYNRRTGQFRSAGGGSYLDSLALADRSLGGLMEILEHSPRWPRTTVIVNGDHSWRIALWKGKPGWTEEDAKASRHGFDSRPLLLIHHAGQSAEETVAKAFPLLGLHDAILSILEEAPSERPQLSAR